MLDDLALLFVHGSLAILFWRLIKTPDPDDLDKQRLRRADRFRPTQRQG